VLGTESRIIGDYVQPEKVRIVFWPVLNHGDPSVYSTVAAECVGRQSPALFWRIHNLLFDRQSDLYGADRDYYVNLAVEVGADQAAFEQCYDDGSGLAVVMQLDGIRRERGIFSQPTFDVNGEIFAGLPTYEQFMGLLDASLLE